MEPETRALLLRLSSKTESMLHAKRPEIPSGFAEDAFRFFISVDENEWRSLELIQPTRAALTKVTRAIARANRFPTMNENGLVVLAGILPAFLHGDFLDQLNRDFISPHVMRRVRDMLDAPKTTRDRIMAAQGSSLRSSRPS